MKHNTIIWVDDYTKRQNNIITMSISAPESLSVTIVDETFDVINGVAIIRVPYRWFDNNELTVVVNYTDGTSVQSRITLPDDGFTQLSSLPEFLFPIVC